MTNPTQLPMAHNLLKKSSAPVMQSQDALESWCTLLGCDAVLVTAQDAFLSEYTPLDANHRYALSGFSGSTGDGIFLTQSLANRLSSPARFQLFVDGRYHLQADQETKPAQVVVHKFGLATGLDDALFAWIRSAVPQGIRLAVDLQRVSWNRWRALQSLAQEQSFTLVGLAQDEIASALGGITSGWHTDRAIVEVPANVTGRSLEKNLTDLRAALAQKLGHNNYTYITCASDDAAWILNARGYHLPNLSSVLAYTFITATACIVHLPAESEACALNFSDQQLQNFQVTRGLLSEAMACLEEDARKNGEPKVVCFSGRAMNAALPQRVLDIFPKAKKQDDAHCLEILRAQKTPQELNSIRASFFRSSRGIASALRAAKNCARAGEPFNEQNLAELISNAYANEGALELSFKTIAGFAENGAVIHYSTPNAQKYAQRGDLLLLDSGAYYSEGFATDCTRVIVFGNTPNDAAPWQKEIYTLTLKSCLAGLRATFSLNTPCKDVDAITRGPIQDRGYDYAHGTGHGIGIHVHESGIRLSPASQYQFTEHAVVSVEPGIYLPGQGGVRIENVAIVVANDAEQADATQVDAQINGLSAHTKPNHTHRFENVVFVGYDWDLIDVKMLSIDDTRDLAAYERMCQSLGTHVTTCPLLEHDPHVQ